MLDALVQALGLGEAWAVLVTASEEETEGVTEGEALADACVLWLKAAVLLVLPLADGQLESDAEVQALLLTEGLLEAVTRALEGLGEREMLPVAVEEAQPVPLALAPALRVSPGEAETETEAEGDTEAPALDEARALPLPWCCDAEPEALAAALPLLPSEAEPGRLGEALGQGEADALAPSEGVKAGLGEALVELVVLSDALGHAEALPLGLPEAEAQPEAPGEALALAASEDEASPEALPQLLALVLALAHLLPEAEAQSDALALALALPEALRQREAEAEGEGARDGEPAGLALALPPGDEEADAAGLPVTDGEAEGLRAGEGEPLALPVLEREGLPLTLGDAAPLEAAARAEALPAPLAVLDWLPEGQGEAEGEPLPEAEPLPLPEPLAPLSRRARRAGAGAAPPLTAGAPAAAAAAAAAAVASAGQRLAGRAEPLAASTGACSGAGCSAPGSQPAHSSRKNASQDRQCIVDEEKLSSGKGSGRSAPFGFWQGSFPKKNRPSVGSNPKRRQDSRHWLLATLFIAWTCRPSRSACPGCALTRTRRPASACWWCCS